MIFRKKAIQFLLAVSCFTAVARAQTIEKMEFTQETLPNGLRVIYAPLHQAPVVHVRLLYHVGSRNEQPNRQGFAHMFEHMMFRGSEHVAAEEHMRLIRIAGGYCNAFTSFDQTVYHQSLPANQLELALYLEADRLASFKVSDDIYRIERKVVGEEARLRENRPYGTVYEDLLKTAFTTHSYRWTPIGKMDHLAAADSSELQTFFNRYYVPNNAVLVVAGDFDLAETKKLVNNYYAWIPRGAEVNDNIPQEAPQTAARRVEITRPVPLPLMYLAWHIPEQSSREMPALNLLASILGQGDSSRLSRRLVNSADALCTESSADTIEQNDPGLFTVNAMALAGKDPETIESTVLDTIQDLLKNGVSEEELAKAKTAYKVQIIQQRQTAESLAIQLGSEALICNDPNRVNTVPEAVQKVTREEIQAVANKYLKPANSTTLWIKPGAPATQPALSAEPEKTAPKAPVAPRPITFPANWKPKAPFSESQITAHYNKGVETQVAGVKVIVIEDHRLPVINWELCIRGGSHSEPAGKEGLGRMTAALAQRGAGNLNYAQFTENLESRGISLNLSDGGDYTSLSGSCTTDQIQYAMDLSSLLLHKPTFSSDEFSRIKNQTLSTIRIKKETPASATDEELSTALFGSGPQGRPTTAKSILNITLDDIRDYYSKVYRPTGAYLVISGDVTVDNTKALAAKLLESWPAGTPPQATYTQPTSPDKRRIILIDQPNARQAAIRIGWPAYSIRSDEKFAGNIAGQILSSGIDSRLGRYIRAQKGLAYGVTGSFSPGRHNGIFITGTDTAVRNTAAAVEAIFKVLNDMRSEMITDEELAQTKTRVAGSMVMSTQSISQLANMRSQLILNDYPLDYFDHYPAYLSKVTAEQVRDVLKKYIDTERVTIVVLAPAAAVKEQLAALGDVEIVPMPAKRLENSIPEIQK